GSWMNEKRAHRSQIDAAGLEIFRAKNLHSIAPGQREKSELIGDVVVARGNDHVSRTEIERGERLEVRHCRVLHDGHVSRLRTDERGHGRVSILHRGGYIVGALVAAEIRFALNVLDDRVDYRLRH